MIDNVYRIGEDGEDEKIVHKMRLELNDSLENISG